MKNEPEKLGVTAEQLFGGLKGPGRGKPITPFKYPLPPEIEAKIGDEKPTVHLITGANGECLCGTDLQTCAEIIGRMLSAPATGDAARIAELERQLAEAKAANSQLTAALNSSSRTMELAGKEIDSLRAQLAASEKDREALKLGIVTAIDIATGHADPMPSLYRVEEHLRAILDAAMKEAR